MTDVIVFLGIQGSGKGTQAKLLAEETGFQHINIGDLFREQISRGSELGKKVQAIITRGDLVEDELVFELVQDSLEPDCPGIIFDGFPRTPTQAEYLLAHYNVTRVYYLELSAADAISRIEARRICSVCGENYNLISRIPAKEGTCDVCGGALKQRSDDTGEAIKKRVNEFYAQTFQLKELFKVKATLVEIPAGLPIDKLREIISKDLELA
jgi:adenylate kinase